MKKNFFKKLSFVLALAMIVSTIMPSAGAFAATKAPKLNSAKQYLYLDAQDGKQEYDFNISNKLTGWKYAWSSSNEDVAEVASNGVATAVGIGTAKVSVVITKKGAEVATLSATVVVKDNIRTLTITNTPAGDKLAVGQENDFNRSFVTSSNSTTKTTGITRWSVNSDKATISDSGLFKATEAGDFVITARSFQSTAKYDAWKVSKDATLVTATKDYTVKVVPSMVEAKQVDLDTFKVTFDSATADAASKLSVVSLVGSTEINQVVKKVTMDSSNKVATVDLYVPFTEKATYVAKYPNMANVQFAAATTDATDVASAKILTTKVEIAEATTIDVALYNKDGVNIADPDLLNRVTLATSSGSTVLSNKDLTMFTVGDTTTITATYHTYNYDTTNGTETGNITASGVVACVDQVVDTVSGISAYTISNTGSPDGYKNVSHNIAVDDASYKLFVQLLVEDDADADYKISSHDALYSSDFEFASSNSDVLIVDNSGNLYAVKAGSASVLVTYKDKVVGSAAVTVGARREVSQVTLDSYGFVLSSDADVQDSKTVSVTVKDQFGTNMDASLYSISSFRETSATTDNEVDASQTQTPSGQWTPAQFTFVGTNADEGTHVYEVKVTDSTTYKTMTVYITVTVKDPSDNNVVYYYKFETNKTNYDMNLNEWAWDNTEDVSISLFGYASNGVRNRRIDVTNGEFTVRAVAPWGNNAQGYTPITADGTKGKIELATGTSGNAVSKKATGTWTLKATNASGAAIASTYFTVADSQDAPTVTVNKLYSATGVANIDAGVKACFTFSVNGDDVTNDIEVLTAADYTGANGVYFIKTVHYHETLTNGAYIDHKVNVNRTITLSNPN